MPSTKSSHSSALHEAEKYFGFVESHHNPSNPPVQALAQEELSEAVSMLKGVLKANNVTLKLGDAAIKCRSYDSSAEDQERIQVESGELTIDGWDKEIGFSASHNGSSFAIEPRELAAAIARGATMAIASQTETPPQ